MCSSDLHTTISQKRLPQEMANGSSRRARQAPTKIPPARTGKNPVQGGTREKSEQSFLDDEDHGQSGHEPAHVLHPAAQDLDQDVGDDGELDPDGDAVGQGHHDEAQDGGSEFRPVVEVQVPKAHHHIDADDDQGRRRRVGGHDPYDRGEEHRSQEEDDVEGRKR